MKVHKLEIMIIDFDDIGAEDAKMVIESAKYPNRCVSPRVMSVDTRDIGEWYDQHPLNYEGCQREFKKLFEAFEKTTR